MHASSPDRTDQLLARWLEEAGRRRSTALNADILRKEMASAWAGTPAKPKGPLLRHARLVFLFGLSTLAYLQYFYLDIC